MLEDSAVLNKITKADLAEKDSEVLAKRNAPTSLHQETNATVKNKRMPLAVLDLVNPNLNVEEELKNSAVKLLDFK